MSRPFPKAGDTYRYQITARDIEKGVPGDAGNCAAARAIQRPHGADESTIYVSDRFVHTHTSPTGLGPIAPLPDRLYNFVADIDHNRPVKPIRFTLTWEQR
jgi:hypothetical protein